MVSETKDPIYVESGRRGAEKRWSNPENRVVVRIDSLTIEQRAVVLALVAAVKKAPVPVETSAPGGRDAGASSTPTAER